MKRVWSIVNGETNVYSYHSGTKKRKLYQELPIQLVNDTWNCILSFLSVEEASILRWVCKYFRNEMFERHPSKGKRRGINKVCYEAIVSTGNVEFVRSIPMHLTANRLRRIRDRSILSDREFPLFKWVVKQGIGMDTRLALKIINKGCNESFEWLLRRPTGLYWDTPMSLVRFTLMAHNPDKFKRVLKTLSEEDYNKALTMAPNMCAYTLAMEEWIAILQNENQYLINFRFAHLYHGLFRAVRLNNLKVFDTILNAIKAKYLGWKALLQDELSNQVNELNPLCAALYYGYDLFVDLLLPYVSPDGKFFFVDAG